MTGDALSPHVSVVMSVFNGQDHLQEAVESILQQTLPDFEFIIINDGSTDGSRAILNRFDDRRIRTFDNGERIGLTRSLNKGLEVARGEYIARMDADDVSLPGRFAQQVKALDKNQHLGLVGSSAYCLLNAARRRRLQSYPPSDLEIKWRLLFENSFLHSSVMFRRDLIDKLGRYDETLKFAQDYELFSRISEHAEVGNLLQPLVIWRYSQGQISTAHRDEQMPISAMVSCGNMRRLLDKAGESYEEAPLGNLHALWSFHHPPIVGQTPEQVIEFAQKLFSVFSRQYRLSKKDGEADIEPILGALRRTALARLYFHAAVRRYRQEETVKAWDCFLKGAFFQPTGIKWSFGGRLALRTLAGRRLFRILKQRRFVHTDAMEEE